MALEVQVHALAEALAAHQRVHHAHDLRPLFVDGGGVEVVDGGVAVGAHRVRHRTSILRELHHAQAAHVLDALDRARRGAAGHVHAEFLVAEDRQALLERQLEPVAAGDAVARPVVEVLVAHHALDTGKVHIGGRGRAGQHVLGVEDVEALVLHGPHVEVFHRHDHEALQVQRQAEARLIPGHGGDERVHRVLGLAQVASAHVHLQQMLRTSAAADSLLARHQVGRHQGEQVAGLGKGVVPLGVVASAVERALRHQVAVGQQHRVLFAFRAQRDGEDRHHVRPVDEVGDAAEALGLTLGEEAAAAGVQARQLGVLLRRAGVSDLEGEGVRRRRVVDDEKAVLVPERHALPVGQHAQQCEVFAVEAQRLAGCSRRVPLDLHLAGDDGLGGLQVEVEFDRADPEGGWCVVSTLHDHGSGSITHVHSYLLGPLTGPSWLWAGDSPQSPCFRLA